MGDARQQVQDCKQRKTIAFLPIDAHGHVNAMIGLADQLRSLGHRTVFLCNDSQSPRHFGHELIQLRKIFNNKKNNEEDRGKKFLEKEVQLGASSNEESIFMGDEKFNTKWAAMVDLLDFRLDKPNYQVQALAHNYRLLKLTLEAEVIPMDTIIERCLIELKPHLVCVDQLCPIPAVWRLSNANYVKEHNLMEGDRFPLKWMTILSCNPMPLYHAHLGNERFPPPLMGLSPMRLRGVELEIEQLRYERALSNSGLQETLLKMASLAAGSRAYEMLDEEKFVKQFALNESPWLNLYMFPRVLDYARDGRGELPANRWLQVDSLIRVSSNNIGYDDQQLLEQVYKWRQTKSQHTHLDKSSIIIIYLSMGTTMSSNLSLMSSLLSQVFTCLEFEPRWRFVIAMGPRAHQLPVIIKHQLQCWQAKGRLLSSGWWPQPELLRRQLVDVCVTHGGNNTLCELFALPAAKASGHSKVMGPLQSNQPPKLVLLAGFHDQLDNARRVADLGWGVALTASQLLEPAASEAPLAATTAAVAAAVAATSGGDLLRSAILGSMELELPLERSYKLKEGEEYNSKGDELRNSQSCAQLIELRLLS